MAGKEKRYRVARGGSWDGGVPNLLSSSKISINPTVGVGSVGFRVASIAVPEPSTIVLAAAIYAFLSTRRRRSIPHNRA